MGYMKSIIRSVRATICCFGGCAGAVFMLPACDSGTPVVSDGPSIEEEVNRRVVQIELEQRLRDLERRLEEQALSAEEKDRLIADQRLLLEEKNRTAQAVSVPSQSPTVSPPPVTQNVASDVGVAAGADYTVFYERLEPYGTWIETPQYGPIWQPASTYTPVGWQPYTRGEWAYADVGWTWVSSEPFGWATYHYGRWSNVSGRGWCWIPGNEWAPAWVSWRTGGDYVGWAPLPVNAGFLGNRIGVSIDVDFGPGNYNFVPTRYFGSSSIYRHVVPRQQNIAIISNTINVTNIVRDNNVIINQGPSYSSLSGVAINPIRTARLRRDAAFRAGNNLSPSWSNGELNVVAPRVAPANPARRVALQRAERLNRIETVTGWEQVRSPVERQRLREQLARQNQRIQARNQAIATAENPVVSSDGSRQTIIEQRAQREVQLRREAAQRERERQARIVEVREQAPQISNASKGTIPQNQAQREAQVRREQAQRERERQMQVAQARQQVTPPQIQPIQPQQPKPNVTQNQAQREAQARREQAQRERERQAQAIEARVQAPQVAAAIPRVTVPQNQAQREAQARREQAQRERERQVQVAQARQQAAQTQVQNTQLQRQATPPQRQPQISASQMQAQREAQARREQAQRERERQARVEEARRQSVQMQRQQPQRQNQAASQPNVAQLQAQREAQARREQAQRERERQAQVEQAQRQRNAEAQRQQQAIQKQRQAQAAARVTQAQQEAQARRQQAQLQRQNQMRAAQGQR